MNRLLTISIPTYNRLPFLTVCLNQLIKQVERYKEDVCVFVTDNCSTDGTQPYMEQLAREYSFIKYNRNERNLGYSGNQINCIQVPESKYIAILCDDDVYLDHALDTIVSILDHTQEWAFVALNYYSFKTAFTIPTRTGFAPNIDKVFDRPYDIFNYPSVGHYSGLIFNSHEAKQILKSILESYDYNYYEQHRGIIGDIACRYLSKSVLPSYFIGTTVLACFQQDVLDYEALSHLCIEYYKYFLQLHTEKLINDSDLAYRKQLVLANLTRASFTTLCKKSKKQVEGYWQELKSLDLINSGNKNVLWAIFSLSKYMPTQFMMRFVYKQYRAIKNR